MNQVIISIPGAVAEFIRTDIPKMHQWCASQDITELLDYRWELISATEQPFYDAVKFIFYHNTNISTMFALKWT
jgi:hypothetical protein